MPMVFRSSPATVSQACSVPDVRAKGNPEAKPKGNMMAIRRFARI
jgi:hypothetical protein